METKAEVISGTDVLVFARAKRKDQTEAATLVDYQTGVTFNLTRDGDSAATKTGSVGTKAVLATEFGFEMLNNTSKIADDLYTWILNGEEVEYWKVDVNRTNDKGEKLAWYMRGHQVGDESDGPSDDNSTRSLSVGVDGEPKRGWLKLSKEQEEQMDYLFRGLDVFTEENHGNGTAFDAEKDAGKNGPAAVASEE